VIIGAGSPGRTEILQRELTFAVPKRNTTAEAEHGAVMCRGRFNPDNPVLRLAGGTFEAADRLGHSALITHLNQNRPLRSQPLVLSWINGVYLDPVCVSQDNCRSSLFGDLLSYLKRLSDEV